MNEVTVNATAMAQATRALVGQGGLELLARIYDEVDAAERRAHNEGYNLGVTVAINRDYSEMEALYHDGFNNGFDAAERQRPFVYPPDVICLPDRSPGSEGFVTDEQPFAPDDFWDVDGHRA